MSWQPPPPPPGPPNSRPPAQPPQQQPYHPPPPQQQGHRYPPPPRPAAGAPGRGGILPPPPYPQNQATENSTPHSNAVGRFQSPPPAPRMTQTPSHSQPVTTTNTTFAAAPPPSVPPAPSQTPYVVPTTATSVHASQLHTAPPPVPQPPRHGFPPPRPANQYHPPPPPQNQYAAPPRPPPPPNPYSTPAKTGVAPYQAPRPPPPPPSPYGTTTTSMQPPPASEMPYTNNNTIRNVYAPPAPPNHNNSRYPTPPGPSVSTSNTPAGVSSRYAPTPMTPQGPAGTGGSSMLDASQMPKPTLPCRPLQEGKALEVYYPKAHIKHASTTGEKDTSAPPPADSRFLVLEDGNASPHMIRSVFSALPRDSQVLRQTVGQNVGNGDVTSSKPLSIMSLMCTPLALPSMDFAQPKFGNDEPLPSSGMMGCVSSLEGSGTVIRCTRCNAYANAFWVAGQCNFCGQKYNIGNVASGTMEYKDLGGAYITRQEMPVQPNVLYCIDVTSVNAWDFFQVIWKDIVPALANHFQTQQESSARTLRPPRIGVAFSLGSQGIYLFNKHSRSLVVMPDVKEDPYCPLPYKAISWNVATELESLEECWTEIAESIVPLLLEQAKDLRGTSAGGAAMKFLVDALHETGGRACYISTNRPNYGIGTIVDRQAKLGMHKAYGTACENWLYTPLQDALPRAKVDPMDQAASKFYKELGQECHKYKVAMDVVLQTLPNTNFLHTATLSKVCQVSNGRFAWITSDDWKTQFRHELLRPLIQFSGWDAVLKIRCSSGLRVQGITSAMGTVLQPNNVLTDDSPEVEFATVSPDTSVCVSLDHRVGGLPKQSHYAYVQTALLYTNPYTQQRRLRVSTLALRVANTPQVAFRSMDFGCLASVMMRQAVMKMTPNPKQEAGERPPIEESMKVVMDRALNILACYRKYGTNQVIGPSQFVLPDRLKLLPLFVLSMRKSPLFRKSLKPHRGGMTSNPIPSPTADERAIHLYTASRCSPATAMYTVHPILLDMTGDGTPLLDWVPGATGGNTMDLLQRSPFVQLPEALQASISNLGDDKVYLLDILTNLYILVGKDVSPEQVQSIQQALQSPTFERDHPIGRAIFQLRLWSQVGRESRWLRPNHAPISIVQSHEPLYQAHILKWMVCDANEQEREYGDFLMHLHKNVVSRMNSI